MRFLICVLLFVSYLTAAPAIGQELWLRPEKYFYNMGEKAKIDLQTGRDFIAEPVAFKREDLESLETIFRTTKIDIRRNFVEGEKAHFTVDVTTEGIHQYIFKSKPASVKIAGSLFNEYLKQYGLDEFFQDREKSNTLADSATVVKNPCIKGYLRAGERFDRRPELPSGLPIEVIPDKNPLLLEKGERISFTVYKNGKPAFGVRVKIWNRWDNRTTIQHIYTLQDGTVSTTISSPGDWMVSVVDLAKTQERNQYIANSFNLVFGFR